MAYVLKDGTVDSVDLTDSKRLFHEYTLYMLIWYNVSTIAVGIYKWEGSVDS